MCALCHAEIVVEGRLQLLEGGAGVLRYVERYQIVDQLGLLGVDLAAELVVVGVAVEDRLGERSVEGLEVGDCRQLRQPPLCPPMPSS